MEIETCQGNVRDNDNSQGNVIEKSCQGKVSQNCSLVDEYLREEQNMREKRKRKDLISSLEQQKKDELKSQTQELDKQIAELKASK